MTLECQQCGQALAEWKAKEMIVDTGVIVRWWYLCDVCLLTSYGPWIGRNLPTVPEGATWRSSNGGRIVHQTAPTG